MRQVAVVWIVVLVPALRRTRVEPEPLAAVGSRQLRRRRGVRERLRARQRGLKVVVRGDGLVKLLLCLLVVLKPGVRRLRLMVTMLLHRLLRRLHRLLRRLHLLHLLRLLVLLVLLVLVHLLQVIRVRRVQTYPVPTPRRPRPVPAVTRRGSRRRGSRGRRPRHARRKISHRLHMNRVTI